MTDTSSDRPEEVVDEFSVNPFLTEERRQELREGKTDFQIGDAMADTAEDLRAVGFSEEAVGPLDTAAAKAYYEALDHGYLGPGEHGASYGEDPHPPDPDIGD